MDLTTPTPVEAPAAQLRRAAELMRQRAQAATPEPWLLAVADWLDGVGYAIRVGDPDDLLGFGEPTAAFAVAGAYLGGPS
jgi:hypothetical protein